MPEPFIFRTWDDYFIPGTSVLRNKLGGPGQPFGETDPAKLSVLEEALTSARIEELAASPIQGQFDYEHMKAIHAHIFQDIYEWAGQERVAPIGAFMTKDGCAYYGAGAHLTEAAEGQYAALAQNDFLRGLAPDDFVRELAEVWGELNVIHSFREGNTRTQFVFFQQFCEQAGYQLDIGQFVPGESLREEFIQARFLSQATGRNHRLAEVLSSGVKPLTNSSNELDSLGMKTTLQNASFPTPPNQLHNTIKHVDIEEPYRRNLESRFRGLER